jgi:hypothetical protein
MLSSFMARGAPAAISIAKSLVAPSLSAFPANYGFPSSNQQQVRWVTKKRQHRQLKRQRKAELAAQGVFPPKPNNYIPKDTPVLNAVSREERDAESKRLDELAAQQLTAKMEVTKSPLMRFGFNGQALQMSDRVRKLFDLHNGNQQEVVSAQKQRGMELFQLREGDTGSSSVQGKKKSSWLQT